MKNEIKDIDSLIANALTHEEARYYKALEEQTLDKQLFGIYKGKLGWVNIMMTIVLIPAFIVTVYALYQFFSNDEMVPMIRWGAIGFIGLMMVSMLKLFAWNQMDKNTIIREMKRMEFQISLLQKEGKE